MKAGRVAVAMVVQTHRGRMGHQTELLVAVPGRPVRMAKQRVVQRAAQYSGQMVMVRLLLSSDRSHRRRVFVVRIEQMGRRQQGHQMEYLWYLPESMVCRKDSDWQLAGQDLSGQMLVY